MAQQRFYWLDIARGICMFFMVTCHFSSWTGRLTYLTTVSGTWFLVFFFFSAGLCYHHRPGFGRYAARQARKLLLPYAAVTAFYLAQQARQGFWPAGSALRGAAASFVYALPSEFARVPLFGVNTAGVGPLWFCPCLFAALLLYRLVRRLPVRGQLPAAAALALLAAASQRALLLPFTLQNACVGCFFIALGAAVRQPLLALAGRLQSAPWQRLAACLLGCAACFTLVSLVLPGQSFDLGGNRYVPLSLVSTLLGFAWLLAASLWLQRAGPAARLAALWGRCSFLILLLHDIDILCVRDWAGRGLGFWAVTLALYTLAAWLYSRAAALVRRFTGPCRKGQPARSGGGR